MQVSGHIFLQVWWHQIINQTILKVLFCILWHNFQEGLVAFLAMGLLYTNIPPVFCTFTFYFNFQYIHYIWKWCSIWTSYNTFCPPFYFHKCIFFSGPFTIIVPVNAAFDKLPADQLAILKQDTGALANVLQYHIVKGLIFSWDLVSGEILTSLNGHYIRVYSRGSVSICMFVVKSCIAH